MEHNTGSSARGSVAVAFLIGAVAGGIAALLLAPQTRAQVRGRIRRGTRDVRDGADDMKGVVSEARTAYRDEMDKRRTPARTAVVEPGEKI